MNADAHQQPLRDMGMSVFGVALESFSTHHQQVEIAILYDALGETIDYYSRRDPFIARLAAAHHGLIFGSAQARLEWLKLGRIQVLEISATHLDSLTMEIGDGIYLTVIVSHASLDTVLLDALTELASQLREEAGS
jgi:predicted regulator of Ras-like GTPase activity (Roadblock/LC7/MglB family)